MPIYPSVVTDYNTPLMGLLKNINIYSGSLPGITLLRWDFPDGTYNGVNIYRSLDGSFTNYTKINVAPVTVNTFTDNFKLRYTNDTAPIVVREIIKNVEYFVLQVQYNVVPTYTSYEDLYSNSNVGGDIVLDADVPSFYKSAYLRVYFKDKIVWVSRVVANKIYCPNIALYNADLMNLDPADLDDSDNWRVEYYQTNRFLDFTRLEQLYYKLSLIDMDGKEINPLESLSITSLIYMDSLDWMWLEAGRRTFWLFWYGGEDILLWKRKWVGEVCSCQDAGTSQVDCPICYGTGIKGGYIGPFRLRMLFSDTRSVRTLKDVGLDLQNILDTCYHMPYPYLEQGDVVIRKNGYRMSVGKITNYIPRGTAILLQSFALGEASPYQKLLPGTIGVEVHRHGDTKVDDSGDIDAATTTSSTTDDINSGSW